MEHPASTVATNETPGRAQPGQHRGRFFLAVPLILVNLSAVWGQAGWAFDNITSGGFSGVIVSLVFALAVESIGVYLAWESHESLMADQASALLRFGSYGVGLLVGLLNFLHFSGQSLAAGVAFGALSAVSPWLWGIWSRARNRTRLAELGLVDVRGVKLSLARKVWHPVRSVRVLSWAAWAGVTDPADAVAQWQESRRRPADTSDDTAKKVDDTAKKVDDTATTPDDEPEFVEPSAPAGRFIMAPASAPVAGIGNPDPAAEAADVLDAELDEMLKIEQVMAEHRVTRDIAEIMVRKGVSRATAYRHRSANAPLA